MIRFSRRWKILLLCLNLAGIVVATYSLYFTERLNASVFPASLICDISKAVSCSTVYLSDYAYILNIPVSFLVLLFFWFMVSMLVMNLKSSKNDGVYQLLGLVNALAFLVCLVFLYILLFVLNGICISCLLIDFIVLVNFFILYGYLKQFRLTDRLYLKTFLSKYRLSILSLLVLFATGFGLFKSYQLIVDSNNRELLAAYLKQMPPEDDISAKTIKFGNPDPEVKILIFNDFLCGYCKIASTRYREIVGETNGRIGIEFVSHPLDYERKVDSNQFDISIFVTKVMLAARDDRNFWRFHDQVVGRVDQPDSAAVFRIAEEELDNYAFFRNLFSNGNMDSLVKTNIDYAKKFKVSGTPTVFVNGREVKQWSNMKLLKMIVSP
jgi:uncharacterized membrane protein